MLRPLHLTINMDVLCNILVVGRVFSEIRVLSVDEEAERGQRRSQFGGLAAGCRQEGVVL